MEYLYVWSQALDTGQRIDAIYLDFSKAFDSVLHLKLLAKLKSFKFHERVIRWINCFLSNRTQAVKCNKSVSKSVSVTSGVPQGSVLGPLLFLLYIYDLPDVCQPCFTKLYADDAKLFNKISNPNDRIVLQQNLDRLFQWSNTWQLPFSPEKCIYLQIGYTDPTVFYSLGPQKLQPASSCVDLGVHMLSSLKSLLYCAQIASKANNRARLILKCFVTHTPANYIRAFKSYLQPLLEYASPVWNPLLVKDINIIENVEHTFTRNVCALCNLPAMSYDERLSLFGLERLELRHLYCNLLEMFKTVKCYKSLICLIVYHLIITLIIIILEAIVLSSMLLYVIKMFLNHF